MTLTAQEERRSLREVLEDLLDALVGARLLRGPARIVDAKVPIIKCCLALGAGRNLCSVLTLLPWCVASTPVSSRLLNTANRCSVPVSVFAPKQRRTAIYCCSLTRARASAGGGLAADISLGAANGCQAVVYVKRQLAAMPQLRPLVLVVKAFLRQHSLNEARISLQLLCKQ